MDNQHIQDGRATKNKSQSKVKTQSYNPIQTMAGLQLSQTSQPRHLMDIHQQEYHTSSQLGSNSSHNSTKKTQILFDITKTQTSMSSPPMKPFLHDFRKTTSQWLTNSSQMNNILQTKENLQNALQHFPGMLYITFSKDRCPTQESQTYKEEQLTKRLQRAKQNDKQPKDLNAQRSNKISCKLSKRHIQA